MPIKWKNWFAVAVFALPVCLHPGEPAGFAQSSAPLQYGQPKELAIIKDERINESSGIAASHCIADAFWTNNDSGDSARIFLFNKNGETVQVVNLEGVTAVDWEDVASFKKDKECRVLIADTGDNAKRRKDYVLYIIGEPTIADASLSRTVQPELAIHFTYEDGPHDCEAVAVDAGTSTVYLVSKGREQGKVYALPIPAHDSKEPNIAKAIETVNLTYATAMDISPDGTRAVILTYSDAYEFSRGKGETWAQAFAHGPRVIKAPARKQGEAVCYGPDGRTLYFTSEGLSQPFWELPVINEGR